MILSGCSSYGALISTADQMPRISELALQAAILERGVGMIIMPGDIGSADRGHEILRHQISTNPASVGMTGLLGGGGAPGALADCGQPLIRGMAVDLGLVDDVGKPTGR